MSIEQAKKLASRYMVATVFVMGMLSTLSIVTRPSGVVVRELHAGRGLASVTETSNAFENETEVIQFDCNKTQFNLDRISQVRIRGISCMNRTASVKSSDVKNQATGLSATVFLTANSSQFTTDFIQLKDGENKITIENKLEDGSVDHSELSITVTQ